LITTHKAIEKSRKWKYSLHVTQWYHWISMSFDRQ
jgi:hypothetical protein